MIILPPTIRLALRANAIQRHATLDRARRAADRDGRDHDPVPVVKFFNPLGAATWLASELYADGDTLFGLADLGFGCPELGVFSLSEIASVRLPLGLGIERDIGFETACRLSKWADTARRLGSISSAEQSFWRDSRAPDPEIPSRPQ